MTTLFQTLFSDRLSDAIGWTLLHSLWQGACLAVPVWLLLNRPTRFSARIRYVISMLALATMFVMACGTFGFVYSAKSAIPVTEAASVVTSAAYAQAPVYTIDDAAPSTPTFYGQMQQLSYRLITQFEAYLPIVVMGWIMGLLVLTIRLTGGLLYIRRLRREQQYVVSDQWQSAVQKLANVMGLQRPIQVVESARVQIPAAIGYFKPLILLPIGTCTGLSPQQVEAVLAHELAHIVRNDYWFNIFQTIMESIFFFHPVVWWLSAMARQEREHCCDDIAVQVSGSTLVYAQALTTLEVRKQAPRLSLAIHGHGHRGSLLNRIQRLLQQPSPKPAFTEGGLVAGLLLVALMAISTQTFSSAQTSTESRWQETCLTSPPETITYYSTFTDTNKVVREIIIVKDKKGKIQEVLVDGKKLSKEEMKNYKQIIEAKLLRAETEEEVVLERGLSALAPISPNVHVDVEEPIDIEEEVIDIEEPMAPIAPIAPIPPIPPIPPISPVFENDEIIQLEEKIEVVSEKMQQLVEKQPYDEKRMAVLKKKLEQLVRQHGVAIQNQQKNFEKEQLEMQTEYEQEMKQYKEEIKEYEKEIAAHKEEIYILEQEQRREVDARRSRGQTDRQRAEVDRRQAMRDQIRAGQDLVRAEQDRIRSEVHRDLFSDRLINRLKKEGLIEDEKHYTIQLTRESLVIDGERVSESVFLRYKKWMKEIGVDLDQWKKSQRTEISHSED